MRSTEKGIEQFISHIVDNLRLYDETHNDKTYHVILPEGKRGRLATTDDGELSLLAWGGFGEIGKALKILQDGSLESIDNTLGMSASGDATHKVRSFYNNILYPNLLNGHVTIDTHAVAAALLRPLSGESTEVKHNLGKGELGLYGPGQSKVTGYNGTYGIYAEAYRRAADKLGLLPRELQSITWEAVRGLYTEVKKRDLDLQENVDIIWDDFEKGAVPDVETREALIKASGGIQPPDWHESNTGHDAGAGSSDVSQSVPGTGIQSGRVESSAGRGDRDSRGTRRRPADPLGAPETQPAFQKAIKPVGKAVYSVVLRATVSGSFGGGCVC